VGCDYPLLGTRHLHRLLLQRDKSKAATVFEAKGFLLPTVALYEPVFFPIMQQGLLHKNHSLRKLLRENAIRIIKTQSRAFTSANTPADYAAVKKELHESIFRNP
ncbi:MAG: hypothetical protein KDD04_11665, partial [Sinomicrobium sp.]|nr:hypothetical protein [Sinomicrobium sp.]